MPGRASTLTTSQALQQAAGPPGKRARNSTRRQKSRLPNVARRCGTTANTCRAHVAVARIAGARHRRAARDSRMRRSIPRRLQIAAVSISQVDSGAPRRIQKPAPLGPEPAAQARAVPFAPGAGARRDRCATGRSSRASRAAVSADRYSTPRVSRPRFDDGARRGAVVEVLQHVVADHEIERVGAPVGQRALRPAVAAGTGTR